ncbi:membrane protein, putative [Geotalea daltonii FRC-32]|uniref:Nicotinamide riboside transporter PnuC n=1 Tax=Geotalea daltonii (strain DSM 22248 / JCM 15807 / FRC-32) TaxID=316067 RepID=A0A068F249_GEODF|nr:nicotinamide mononucleotide transporter [Geotalea daltonii]AID57994.1 membrane protein, putative [Geotalea daltonii FRC-32]
MNANGALTWLLVAGSLLGGQLVINKRRTGYLIWVVINVFWVFFYYYQGIYASVFLFTVYSVQALYGFFKWKNRDETTPSFSAQAEAE